MAERVRSKKVVALMWINAAVAVLVTGVSGPLTVGPLTSPAAGFYTARAVALAAAVLVLTIIALRRREAGALPHVLVIAGVVQVIDIAVFAFGPTPLVALGAAIIGALHFVTAAAVARA